jgi:hypothetical protein
MVYFELIITINDSFATLLKNTSNLLHDWLHVYKNGRKRILHEGSVIFISPSTTERSQCRHLLCIDIMRRWCGGPMMIATYKRLARC